jgi:uncharacterized protein (TIGR02246 family)
MTPTSRPALSLPSEQDRAETAVTAFVAELQHGLDSADATAYNAHFADDVIWGGPFGAIVDGYDNLHPIHRRLQRGGNVDASRYDVLHVLVPAPGVAVAHVRRVPQQDNVPGAFSEVVLFVLVLRGGTWWLAAGQNTPVQPGRSAVDTSAS